MENIKDILEDFSNYIDQVSINLTKQELYELEKIEKRLYNYVKEQEKIKWL